MGTAAPPLTQLPAWRALEAHRALLGMREELDEIHARLPGIEVAGAVYDGVGIPAVIASATRAARATVQHLSSTAYRTGEHPA